MAELDLDVYAASTRATVKYRRRLVDTLLADWSEVAVPISHRKIKCLAASLKAGGYRSASAVLSLYKIDAERRGEVLGPSMLRLLTDMHRSCARGRGPAVAAAPLPMDRLTELDGSPEPWSNLGPLGPQNAIVCGTWWMLRELELATLRAALVEIREVSPPVAVLTLPASKNDFEGLGATRALACVCLGGPPRRDCPCHAVWDQKLLLQRRFPGRHAGGQPDADLPLFPLRSGAPASKSAMVAMIREAAKQLGVPAVSADGAFRISGHSLRPSGAQGLARLGVDVLTIQALGRWGTTTVAQYVRGASTSEAAAASRAGPLGAALAAASGPERLSSEDVARQAAQVAKATLRSCMPAVVHRLRAELAKEVASRTARESESSSSDSSSSDSSVELLASTPAPAAPEAPARDFGETVACKSSRKKLRHRVLIGPGESLDATRWVTVCGWRFGAAGTARHVIDSDAPCQKCW